MVPGRHPDRLHVPAREAWTSRICVMNADGSGQIQLTANTVLDATPSWSPGWWNHLCVPQASGRSIPAIRLIDSDGAEQRQTDQHARPQPAPQLGGALRVHVN